MHLDRFVAIKVLPQERVANPTRKARFLQEARAASALNHPNIIHVYAVTADNGVDFIAKEYAAGKTPAEPEPTRRPKGQGRNDRPNHPPLPRPRQTRRRVSGRSLLRRGASPRVSKSSCGRRPGQNCLRCRAWITAHSEAMPRSADYSSSPPQSSSIQALGAG